MADALRLDKARAIECLRSMVRGTADVIGPIEDVGMRVEAFRLAYTTVERGELPVEVLAAIELGIAFEKDARRLRVLLAARGTEQVLREGDAESVIARVIATRGWGGLSLCEWYRLMFLTRSPELFSAAAPAPAACQAERSLWRAFVPSPRSSTCPGPRP